MAIEGVSSNASIHLTAMTKQMEPKVPGPDVPIKTSAHSDNLRPGVDKLRPSYNSQGQAIGNTISVKG
jgi:hypothetical protein